MEQEPDNENKEIQNEHLPDQKEFSENNRLAQISLHQRMLSRMVKVGYAGLTDEERAYWNSVY